MQAQKKLGQKIRWLKQALILSVIFNGILTAVFFYFIAKEDFIFVTFDFPLRQLTSEKEFSNQDVLEQLYKLPFSELVLQLKDRSHVEYGYTRRDLTLVVLREKYFIDVERALNGSFFSKKTFLFHEKKTNLFGGLTDDQFGRIQHFLSTEKWPFTSEGLHQIVKKQGLNGNASLIQIFMQTPEIMAVQTLFSRTGLPIKKGSILVLCSEIDWQILSNFLKQQQEGVNFSEEVRRAFLREAIHQGSRTAAYLILLTDYTYAFKSFSDDEIVKILSLTDEKTDEAFKFAKEILNSIRSDFIIEAAKKKVELFEGGSDKMTAARFEPLPKIGELRPKFRSDPPEGRSPSVHLVQPGESLWTISQKYHVPIEEIMAINRLQTKNIQSGKTLKIPSK